VSATDDQREDLAAAESAARRTEDLIDVLSSPWHLVMDYRTHVGNVDYEARVCQWAMDGVDRAAVNRRPVEAAQVLQLGQPQVAAAGAAAWVEADDGELYDRVYGDSVSDRQAAQQRLEHLYSIASGGAVSSPIADNQPQAGLERLAHSGGEIRTSRGSGPFPVSADAARAVLARLDRAAGR
jgi:hypothetical protein